MVSNEKERERLKKDLTKATDKRNEFSKKLKKAEYAIRTIRFLLGYDKELN